MQRREFAKTMLTAAGAACLPIARSVGATRSLLPARRLAAVLARQQGEGGAGPWQPVVECRTMACHPSTRLRIAIESIAFHADTEAFAIDAVFDTTGGPQPFRIAHFQPDSLSPVSKPFAFELAASTLAGFHAEVRGAARPATAVAHARNRHHPSIQPGRYQLTVLDATHGDQAQYAALQDAAHPAVLARLTFAVAAASDE